MTEPLLDGVVQIGIVTNDADRLMRAWSDRYGVGPWEVYDFDSSNMTETTVDDRPVEFGMRIALALLGTMQLELIEPHDDRSIYAASLEKHGGADHFHHILCSTADYDSSLERARSLGVGHAQSGRMSNGATFSYLSTEDELGLMLEIARVPQPLTMPEPVAVYPRPDAVG